jgi:hypothetical protein
MIHAKPGNLIAVSANGKFYYALVLRSLLPRARGHWCFVFQRTSEHLLSAAEILNGDPAGFYQLVDFIWAKRQNRLLRIAEKIDIRRFDNDSYLKSPDYECINDSLLVKRINQNWLAGKEDRPILSI